MYGGWSSEVSHQAIKVGERDANGLGFFDHHRASAREPGDTQGHRDPMISEAVHSSTVQLVASLDDEAIGEFSNSCP